MFGSTLQYLQVLVLEMQNAVFQPELIYVAFNNTAGNNANAIDYTVVAW